MLWIHICLFLENTHPNKKLNLIVGGIENQILQLLPAFEKIKNIKISIITKYSKYKPLSNRVKIYEFHKFYNKRMDTIYFLINSFFKIVKLHKKDRIDFLDIHTHEIIILPILIVRIIFKIPIIMKIPLDYSSYITQINLLEKKMILTKIMNLIWLKLFLKRLIKRINYIRVLNDKMYSDLIILKFPKDNILKLPNGIDSKKFINVKKKIHKETHYGYVGRLTEFKNIRFLLNCFVLYLSTFPNDKLFIYGKGPEENFILDFIKQKKLEDNIFFEGFEKDKTKIYSNLDVIIDPALGQGISNTNLEAMCTNTFIIASDVYGNNDIITNGFNGLLFNPKDKNDLLKQLKFYKQNENLILEIKKKAKENALINYDIEVVSNKIYYFLNKKLKSKNIKTNIY